MGFFLDHVHAPLWAVYGAGLLGLALVLWGLWAEVLQALSKRPKTATRRYVIASAIVVVAAVAGGGIFFSLIGSQETVNPVVTPSPKAEASRQPALLEARRDIHMEGDWWELPKGWTRTIARAGGSIWDKGSHYLIGQESIFPTPDGTATFISLAQLRAQANELATAMNDWEYKTGGNEPGAEVAYYKAHFADRALSLTTEMLHRLGVKDLHVPKDWPYQRAEVGREIIATKTAMGPSPLNAASAYMLFLVYQLSSKGQLKIPPSPS